MVKNMSANSRDTGLILDPERSHMPWSNKAHETQLWNLCPRACEPQFLKPCTQSPRSATREATAMRSLHTKLERRTRWLQQEKNSCCSEDPVQFSSVAQLCLTLCDPMDCSTPGFSVHLQLPEHITCCESSSFL